MGKYGIKDEYVHRDCNATLDADGRCFWTPERLRLSQVLQWYDYEWARSVVVSVEAKEVLDIGCGPAVKLNELIAPVVTRFVGIDQPSAIEYAQTHFHQGQYVAVDLDRLADFEDDPLLARQYDFILCVAVIEHLIEPDQLLQFVKRRVRPTGHILLSTCDRDRVRGLFCARSPKPEHVREWNVHEFLAYMRQHGLSVRKIMHCPPRKMTKAEFWAEQGRMSAQGDGRCLFHEMAFLLQYQPPDVRGKGA